MEEKKLAFSHFMPLMIAVWCSASRNVRITHAELLYGGTNVASPLAPDSCEHLYLRRKEAETAPGIKEGHPA